MNVTLHESELIVSRLRERRMVWGSTSVARVLTALKTRFCIAGSRASKSLDARRVHSISTWPEHALAACRHMDAFPREDHANSV